VILGVHEQPKKAYGLSLVEMSGRIGAVPFLLSAGDDVRVRSCGDPGDVWWVGNTAVWGLK
jgi:hypothetical protein